MNIQGLEKFYRLRLAEAQRESGILLTEDVFSYLIALLVDLESPAYSLVPTATRIPDLLRRAAEADRLRRLTYGKLAGDASLLSSGIFFDDGWKAFSLADIIAWGQTAYRLIEDPLFQELADEFFVLVNILQTAKPDLLGLGLLTGDRN